MLAAILPAACSGSTEVDDPAAGGETGGVDGSGGALEGSGGGEPVASGGLSGIWDAIGSRLGGRSSGAMITIESHRLEILADELTLVVTPLGDGFDVIYGTRYREERLLATRTSASAADLGEFPLDLAGGWLLTDTAPGVVGACESLLTDGALTASCQDVAWVPGLIRELRDGIANGERTTELPSIFGDLGGVWQIQGSRGGYCEVRFEGQTFSADCSGEGSFDGVLEAEFDGTIMSGRTSSGIEFSAQRR
jgi:hypothetical protein